MRANEFDLLVIGEGLAGICAAAAAARSGMRVMLASKGPGNFVLGTACVDLDGITSAELRCPGLLSETVGRSTCFLRRPLRRCRLRLRRRHPGTTIDSYRDGYISDSIVRPAFPLEGRSANGCEGSGHRHRQSLSFRRRLRCRAALLPHSAEGFEHIVSQRHDIRLQDLQRPLTTVDIATRWDRNPAYRKALVDSLRNAVRDAEVLILPGVLGVKSSDHDFRQLEETIGCAICELPTMPPSVPGLRLLHRFENHLIGLGVELCTGFAVQRLCLDGDRCTGVELDTPGKATKNSSRSRSFWRRAASRIFSNLMSRVLFTHAQRCRLIMNFIR